MRIGIVLYFILASHWSTVVFSQEVESKYKIAFDYIKTDSSVQEYFVDLVVPNTSPKIHVMDSLIYIGAHFFLRDLVKVNHNLDLNSDEFKGYWLSEVELEVKRANSFVGYRNPKLNNLNINSGAKDLALYFSERGNNLVLVNLLPIRSISNVFRPIRPNYYMEYLFVFDESGALEKVFSLAGE